MENQNRITIYRGQIWTDGQNSFRKVTYISKKEPKTIKYVDSDDPGATPKKETLDEFMWWVVKNKARPLLQFFDFGI